MGSTKSTKVFVVTLTAVVAALVGSVRSADNFRVLHAFTNGADGGSSWAGLIIDAQGNLYGTTSVGGAFVAGTVFKLSPGLNGKWSETVLHSFQPNSPDGAFPKSRLVFDKSGNLYGTTTYGSAGMGGTVFRLAPDVNNEWIETVLCSFASGGPEGSRPNADLVFDSAGNIYGTTPDGGANQGGTVFKLTPGLSGTRSETVLYSFNVIGGDGFSPQAGVILDAGGNLYGTTMTGGAHPGGGTVFKLTPGSNGTWSETLLHSFASDITGGGDGSSPNAGLIFDAAGNLYGTTWQSGTYAAGLEGGTVFKLAPGPNGTWSETVLHSFSRNSHEGFQPQAPLIMDKAGNLYGTTSFGGPGVNSGGTVFRLAPDATGAWALTLLHSFATNGAEGFTPFAGLIFDPKGNLYGTASTGVGTFGGGMVFEILSGSGAAASSNIQAAPSSAPSSPSNPAPSSPTAAQGTDPLASIWQSDAYVGQTFRFKLEGNAIYVYGEQQELLGTLDGKEKKGAIDVYQGLVKIAPVTQCPGGRGLMQIKSWSQNRLDAKIETPVNTSEGVSCGGVLGSGRLVPWQKVTFVKR